MLAGQQPARPPSRAGSSTGGYGGGAGAGGGARPSSMYAPSIADSLTASGGMPSPALSATPAFGLSPSDSGIASTASSSAASHSNAGHTGLGIMASAAPESLDELSQTLAMYRANIKRTKNPDLQLEFARFLLQHGIPMLPDRAAELRAEAFKMCKKAAASGGAEAQFHLAECYETGVASEKGKSDYSKAFTLYLSAAKQSHAESSYRAAVYTEHGRGTSKSQARALQFYQKAGALGHPGAAYRLGMAELHGELGLPINPRNGIKWLSRSASSATPEHCEGLYELALLHETGIDHVVYVDHEYAVKLLREAAQLGHVMAMYRLGSYYEHGNHVQRNPATSFSYFKAAAERGHPDSMFGVASWYLTGNREASVPQSDESAFEWMKRAAEAGLIKAFFALGYLYEEGIGTTEDLSLAKQWYERALTKGDKRAAPKLSAIKRQLERDSSDPAAAAERRRTRLKKKRAAQAAAQQSATEREAAVREAIAAREAEREKIRKQRMGEDACTVM